MSRRCCRARISIPNIRIDVSVHVSNKTPVGTYRGPGRFEADFFRERLLDMVARDLKLDGVEFRRRNLIAEAQMPYALATVVPLNIATETDTGDYRETLDRCLAEIDWSEKAALQGKLIDGRYHGLAVGCYIEGGASGPRENARMVLETDGTSRSMSDRRRWGRGSRPSSRRSRPMRWKCRSTASAASITARPRTCARASARSVRARPSWAARP